MYSSSRLGPGFCVKRKACTCAVPPELWEAGAHVASWSLPVLWGHTAQAPVTFSNPRLPPSRGCCKFEANESNLSVLEQLLFTSFGSWSPLRSHESYGQLSGTPVQSRDNHEWPSQVSTVLIFCQVQRQNSVCGLGYSCILSCVSNNSVVSRALGGRLWGASRWYLCCTGKSLHFCAAGCIVL